MKKTKTSLIPQETIEGKILLIRDHKVMLDKDLAKLYSVTTSNLNKAVIRNIDRFPDDFMFRLSKEDFKDLKFHFGTSSWGGTRKLPRAFTEQGDSLKEVLSNIKEAIELYLETLSEEERNESLSKEILTTTLEVNIAK
jgi:predicted RNase H-like HicB family nuclease